MRTITVPLILVNLQDNGFHILVEIVVFGQRLFAVVDTGVGISDETIAHILNGGSNSSDGTEGEKGYGFGLKMIKHLIDGLKGSMEITSIEDQGTRFEVKLPQY